MSTDRSERFLSRWSRRKLPAAREPAPAGAQAPGPAAQSAVAAAVVPPQPATMPAASTPGAPVLPAVETLNFESDFTAFLQPGVEPAVQQAALRKLLHDPRFNVMDGLDVYIDDYTKPSPLDPAIARMLADAQNLFVPRVDAADQATHAADAAHAAAESTGTMNGATSASPSANVADEAPAGASVAQSLLQDDPAPSRPGAQSDA